MKFNLVTFLDISFKVEKILKGSLDSILSPSPSVKIQIMDVKFKGKTLLGIVDTAKLRQPSGQRR